MLKSLRDKGFQLEFRSHAEAILGTDFPTAVAELEGVLHGLSISLEDLVRGGGGEAKVTQSIRHKLERLGWDKHEFLIRKLIDGKESESITHQIDHVRSFEEGTLALEIEWNNKDPFFDRDLENFKRLHAEGAISIGIIITRGSKIQENIRDFILNFAEKHNICSYDDLIVYEIHPTVRQRQAVTKAQNAGIPFADAWSKFFCADKYGQSTTHWRKLDDRIRRGVGNPCPLLLIGIPDTAIAQ